MAAVSLPDRPGIPSKSDMENPQKMLEYQQAMANYNLAVQTIQQTQNEEQATRSNMSKSRHDAMMAIASNLKA